MKCPQCQFNNPEQMKFCGECGAKLEKICSKCNYVNPSQFKFCGDCGHNLTSPSETAPIELSFDEKISNIQKYLPHGLTEKILSQRNKIVGEHKQVTVMFCDMEGYTPVAEKLGPEESYSIMDQVYEFLIHKVRDYDGTVNEMTGDGIMALFGAPIALEDGPQRAIRSAYAIHREMTKLGDRLKQEEKRLPPLKMRIGIHTGPVVVGTLGNDLRVEFKAVGDTVNLASRLEGLAEPGSTYVSEETFKLTEGYFRFEALGQKEIKGKESLVRVYRVIAPNTRRTRFDISTERGLTPFLGRERELEFLLDGFERAKGERGQAFFIVSDAGVGKSRLLYEFRKAVANENITFLEGKCLSYSQGVAYHPIIDILKSNFNIQEGDEDSEIIEKVKEGLEVLGADESSTLPYLLELLPVRDSGIDKNMMSPEGIKDRIFEALNRIILKGSEIKPLVMALEDIHWIDKSSEDALKGILNIISGSRVLLIFTHRPEYVCSWGGKSYVNQLNLVRFSNRESLIMTSYLLGTGNMDTALEELILERTEGIPFFIEEFIKSLKDLRIIEKKDSKYVLAEDKQGLTIPSTIQDVIMARVDKLPEGVKEILRTGSVIEREFSHRLIKHVTGLSEQELLSHLSLLKDAEILYERGIYPETTYIFKHALTRDVVYDSILSKRKKQLHEEIGIAIEDLNKDDLDQQFEILAQHFIASKNYEKGENYSKLAGKKCLNTGSLNDAIFFAEKRIACLERLKQTEAVHKKIVDTRTVLGLYYLQINCHVEAKEIVEPIVDFTVKYNYQNRLSQIYVIFGAYSYVVEEDFDKAIGYLKDASKLSEVSKDILSVYVVNYWFGVVRGYECDFEKAISFLEVALKIILVTKTTWGIAALKGVTSYFVYFLSGNIEQSYRMSEEAIRLAEESTDIYSKAMTYICHGISCYGQGDIKMAIKNLRQGIVFCKRINYLVWEARANSILSEIYLVKGEHNKFKEHLKKSNSLLRRCKFFPSWINGQEMLLAGLKLLEDKNNTNLNNLPIYYDQIKLKEAKSSATRKIAKILIDIDNQHLPEAEDWIIKAIDIDKRNGMMFYLGRDYALYAELLERKGETLKAKENLNKAIEILKECGADGWVGKYEMELASLS
ncbi:adenylate/guanylate cyclase domain-containing protein [Thermodesulfobacteriota bacterium]